MEDFRSKRKETREWRPFSEARAFVHTLGFKNIAQWQAYGKAGKRPYDIPGNPDKVYITELKGYGDWLGTGTIDQGPLFVGVFRCSLPARVRRVLFATNHYRQQFFAGLDVKTAVSLWLDKAKEHGKRIGSFLIT